MSTTFGVKVRVKDYFDGEEIDEVIEVARRTSGGMRWVNNLAIMLGDDIPVVAIDNGHQGVYTIGDIRRVIDGD
jgi:hypothetical protein